MAISVTYRHYNSDTSLPYLEKISKTLRRNAGVISLDSSYSNTSIASDGTITTGGEALTTITNDFGYLVDMHLTLDPESSGQGLVPAYNRSTGKLQFFAPAPLIVHNEEHTIASNAITLNYPAALIMNMATAGQHQIMVDVSATMGSNQAQLANAMTLGVCPTIDFHASTSGVVKVTYITQAWTDIWENRVTETLTTASEVASSLYVYIGLESLHGSHASTDLTNFGYLRGGDVADTTECEIDLTDSGNSNLTTFTFKNTDTITAAIPTGIKLPASGFLNERFLEDQDNTLASGVSAALNPTYPILFHTLCGQLPDYTAANERPPHTLQMPAFDALGTSLEFYINYPVRPGVGITSQILLQDTSSDAVSLSYVYGTPDEIPNQRLLEVPNGVDLSNVKVYFTANGRTRN